MTMRIVGVVAVARNGVIGNRGAMPWHLATDLKRYRQLTMGKPMIMGRKTLESIGKVLDGRDTVVLTSRAETPFEGAHVAGDVEEALSFARRLAGERSAEEIVIAGGGEIYRLFFDRLDRLYITFIDAEPEGDARFPAIDMERWHTVGEEAVPAGPKDSAATRFLTLDRR